jgi:hypothetical protein
MEVSRQLHAPAALPPVPVGQETGLAPELGLDVMEKREILPLLGIEPRPSSSQAVAISTELSRLIDRSRYKWIMSQEACLVLSHVEDSYVSRIADMRYSSRVMVEQPRIKRLHRKERG